MKMKVNVKMTMKKLVYGGVALAFAATTLTGCKTTEENYRSAYEIAKAKKTEGLTEGEIAGMAREEAAPKSVYKGDSIPLKGMYVKLAESANVTAPLTYNVVVASFKQRFNARSVYNRLREGGYPDALILADRDETYFIAAQTTASLDSAVATLHALEKESPVALRAPFPYIIRKP